MTILRTRSSCFNTSTSIASTNSTNITTSRCRWSCFININISCTCSSISSIIFYCISFRFRSCTNSIFKGRYFTTTTTTIITIDSNSSISTSPTSTSTTNCTSWFLFIYIYIHRTTITVSRFIFNSNISSFYYFVLSITIIIRFRIRCLFTTTSSITTLNRNRSIRVCPSSTMTLSTTHGFSCINHNSNWTINFFIIFT